jgi:hypothetical protein
VLNIVLNIVPRIALETRLKIVRHIALRSRVPSFLRFAPR